MTKNSGLKKLATAFLSALFLFGGAGRIFAVEPSDSRTECMECHKVKTPGLYGQWKSSVHASLKPSIGCYSCHQANRGDADTFAHYGTLISAIVSPKDCGRCHPGIVEEFSESSHATTVSRTLDSECANLFKAIISADGFDTPGFTGHALTGDVTGCMQCHGSQVQVKKVKDERGDVIEYDPATWPNEGIGRINPDNSAGSCIACHQRHEFSVTVARQPESCGKCHVIGSGNPMLDIYKASDHGRAYYTNTGRMNLDAKQWILGETYSAAPTCATCHMGSALLAPEPEEEEAEYMPATHNVSLRFNWDKGLPDKVPTDKDPPCKCPPDKLLPCECNNGYPPASNPPGDCDKPRPEDNDQVMKSICLSCHRGSFIEGYCSQRKGQEQMLRDKYLVPGNELYTGAKKVLYALAPDSKAGKYAYFKYPIDSIWFDFNHLVSQVNIAVTKGSPDYAYTGNLGLIESWFRELVPELRRIIEKGKNSSEPSAQSAAAKLEEALDSTLQNPIYGKNWENKYNLECKEGGQSN